MVHWRRESVIMLLGAALLAMCSVGFGEEVDRSKLPYFQPCIEPQCDVNPCGGEGLQCCGCRNILDGTQGCQCCPAGHSCCRLENTWTCCPSKPIKPTCNGKAAEGSIGKCLSSATAISANKHCGTCDDMQLSITADNVVQELFIDGKPYISQLSEKSDWEKTDTFSIPFNFETIAIKASGDMTGERAGILISSTDDYLLTNSSWKCTTELTCGWEEPTFDDSAWPVAVRAGYHSNDNFWMNRPEISINAEWIWTENFNGAGLDLTVYCRKSINIGNGCGLNYGDCSDFCGSGTCCGCNLDPTGPTKDCSCCPTGYHCCSSPATDLFRSSPVRYCCPTGSECLANGQCSVIPVEPTPPITYGRACGPDPPGQEQTK